MCYGNAHACGDEIEGKTRGEGLKLLRFKNGYRAIVMKIVRYWYHTKGDR